MYISTMGMRAKGITVRPTTHEAKRMGEYAITFGESFDLILYLSQEEAETLYASLFEMLLNAEVESKNVRVIP